MPQTILVTGATGFAGSHLIERLPDGTRIVAWARPGGTAPASSARTADRVEWKGVDLLDRAGIAKALSEAPPDLVYHVAGAPHVGTSFDNPALPLSINALGTHYLLEALRHAAPRARVLVVTSAMIYGPSIDPHTEDSPMVPGSPYGLSKLAQDRLAAHGAADGMNAVIARPFNHTGARQDPSFSMPGFAQQIARIEAGRAEPVIRVGNLDARRDISDVRDVVDAYAVIAERGTAGTAYNVCSGVAWRIGDLLEQMVRTSTVALRLEEDESRLRPIELPFLVGDNSRLRALGWAPRVPIETMLEDVLDYWRARER